MIHIMRGALRSWMFIYAGLVAAIVLASQPVSGTDRTGTESRVHVLVTDAPLGRADI